MIRRTNQIWGVRRSWNGINRNQPLNEVSNFNYSVNASSSQKTDRNRASSLTYNVLGEPRKTVSKDEIQKYDSLMPSIIKDLTNISKNFPERAVQHFTKFLDYNLPNHCQSSGLAVVSAYKAFESIDNLTPTNINLSHILGWCVDILQCGNNVNSDLIEGSDTRRGLKCWNKIDGIGVFALNDTIAFAQGSFILLKKYFSKHPAYIPCIETIHDINLKTAMGVSLEQMHRLNGEPNLEAFTTNRFKALAKYKTAYGEFLLPIKLAIDFANKYNEDSYKPIKNLMIKLGEYFTAQNDILDCYGDLAITGKVGDDIPKGKCTWLVVNALERATRTQRQVLKEHYGSVDSESEFKIRTLYEDLGILEKFLEYEKESYKIICEDVEKMPKNIPSEFFAKLVDTVYGRY